MLNASQAKLQIEPLEDGSGENCCTFVFYDEDHTLGNALRYIIMKNPEVEFCGYSIPHPAENKLNLRIQTNGVSPTDVLRKGLEELLNTSDHVLKTFEDAIFKFEKDQD
ncbi:DNA-directed RNA polymerases I and III subunit RPAC2-like [Styela clava]